MLVGCVFYLVLDSTRSWKKTDRVYPFLAIAHDINIYLVLRMYVRNDYQETTMRNPRRTDKCHNLCSDVLYTSKSLRQQTAETTS